MKRINSLSDLLMEELADLLNAENQLAGALPKMVEASHSSALKVILEDCLEITKKHVKRLEDIFSNIRQKPKGMTSEPMKRFIMESKDSDLAIISVVQHVQQYAIEKYKMAREHAADLGHTRMVEVLSETLKEGRAMNFYLNELAQFMINVQAVGPKGSQKQESVPQSKEKGFYIPEGKFTRGSIKKKPKNMDVSRFISEGNPNVEDLNTKEEKKEE